MALPLRDLQALSEIGVENNTTVDFAVPFEILKKWMQPSTWFPAI